MKKILTFLLFSTLYIQANAQCSDSISVTDISYSAFTDSSFEFTAWVQGTQTIAYPSFAFVDVLGDTIADARTQTFLLGNGKRFELDFTNLYNGNHRLNGQLLIYSNLGDSMVCLLDVDENLCQLDTLCHTIELSLGNFGGALVMGSFDWRIKSDNRDIIQFGQFNLDPNTNQEERDTLCIPSGKYSIELDSAVFSGGQLFYGINHLSNYSSFLSGQYIYKDLEIKLDLFESCADTSQGSNSIETISKRKKPQIWLYNNQLVASENVKLNYAISLLGNIHHFESDNSIYNWKTGLYIISFKWNGEDYYQRIFIP